MHMPLHQTTPYDARPSRGSTSENDEVRRLEYNFYRHYHRDAAQPGIPYLKICP